MKFKIDNFDGTGLRDYSQYVTSETPPRIRRRLNRPSECEFVLAGSTPDFVVPAKGARILVERSDNGNKLFTGYLVAAPEFEYLGWGERGPAYLYHLKAHSDELLLDSRTAPVRSPFVARSAGDGLRQITEDVLPGAFDSAGIQPLDTIPSFPTTAKKKMVGSRLGDRNASPSKLPRNRQRSRTESRRRDHLYAG